MELTRALIECYVTHKGGERPHAVVGVNPDLRNTPLMTAAATAAVLAIEKKFPGVLSRAVGAKAVAATVG